MLRSEAEPHLTTGKRVRPTAREVCEVGHTGSMTIEPVLRPEYAARVPKRRLDTLLAQRGLFDSRTRAAAAVLAGDVRVDERPATKPGELVAEDAELAVQAPRRRSSRAAGSSSRTRSTPSRSIPSGRRCLDVGASTGGFTDCLLQRGAEAVVALDVAYGELHWRLRQDPRVTVIERSNARSLERRGAALGARPDRDRRLLHRPGQGAARRCSLPRRRASTAWRWSSRSSRSGASASARAGWCARPPTAAPRWSRSASCARGELGASLLGFASSGLPGPAGNRESFAWLAEAGRDGRAGGRRGRGAKG